MGTKAQTNQTSKYTKYDANFNFSLLFNFLDMFNQIKT